MRADLKRDFLAVRNVLDTAWNPVGVSGLPADEYDSYVWPVLRLLREGADEIQLAEHLVGVEQFYFSGARGVEQLIAAARQLKALQIGSDP